MKEFITVLEKYTEFSGRARRKEFWMFTLFNTIFTILFYLIGIWSGIGLLSFIYGFVMLVPSIAVTVRRLHDINRNGWYILILLIPYLGWIGLIILNIMPGTIGDNKYGPDPKAVEIIA